MHVKIRLYFAEKGPTEIETGTFQGDILSPLLFSILIEPVLRWLQTGGRGYKCGCLSKSLHADHTTCSSAHTDDMSAVTALVLRSWPQSLPSLLLVHSVDFTSGFYHFMTCCFFSASPHTCMQQLRQAMACA